MTEAICVGNSVTTSNNHRTEAVYISSFLYVHRYRFLSRFVFVLCQIRFQVRSQSSSWLHFDLLALVTTFIQDIHSNAAKLKIDYWYLCNVAFQEYGSKISQSG